MSKLLDVHLPVSLEAPRTARHEVRRLSDALDTELRGDVALLASELVSNSIVHAWGRGDCIQLKAWIIDTAGDTAVRVSVGDAGPGFAPCVVVPEPTVDGHRGLWLVDTLADAWGIAVDGGTWSWFEIHGVKRATHGLRLDRFLDAVTDWPLRSKDLAWSMAASLGPPDDVVPHRLTWTTPQCVATILCPDRRRSDADEHRCRGQIEERCGRWWLETLHSRSPSPPGERRSPLPVG
jgi:anti-sigma regulatory factor (Ser/Thr protein kinase)